jgi:pSer/pThr/pTyr-binding forkhead associated (FHA) protein
MDSGGTFQLVMRQGPQPGEIFPISGMVMTIGRDARNDITVNDPEVSRQHAQLSLQAQGYVITDQGSTNGTFVNGKRLAAPYRLSNGDEVGLGETVVMVYQIAVREAIETVLGPGSELDEVEPAAEIPPLPFEFDSPEAEMMPPLPFGDSAPEEPAPPPPFTSEVPSRMRVQPEPMPAPPPTFEPQPKPKPEPVPAPPPQFVPERKPVSSLPPTAAIPAAPPPYAPAVMDEEEKPSRRKWLLIGCGCLLLLVVCSVVGYFAYTFGTAIWNAPPEFWDDPLNNWDLLPLIITPLLPFLI